MPEKSSITSLPSRPNNLGIPFLDFHPQKEDWLLFMGGTECPNCHTEVYFSTNNGKKWEKIEEWAQKCIFLRDSHFDKGPEKAIYCSAYRDNDSSIGQDRLNGLTTPANPLQLVMWYLGGHKRASTVKISENVVDFYVFDNYMVVATVRMRLVKSVLRIVLPKHTCLTLPAMSRTKGGERRGRAADIDRRRGLQPGHLSARDNDDQAGARHK
jgi:hypothetical protein